MKLIKKLDEGTKLFGFHDTSGAVVVPYVYTAVGEWNEGYIYVKRPGWRGFLDENADEVCPLNEYAETGSYPSVCNGVCVVSRVSSDGHVVKGCVDMTGTIVVPVENAFCQALTDSVFVVVKDNQRLLKRKDGSSVDISEYLAVGSVTAGEYVTVSMTGKYGLEKWGCIDFQGRLVIPNLYDGILASSSKLITVRNGNRFGIVDMNGNAVTDLIYTQAKCFQEGRCAVKNANGWGFIDETGKQCIPCQFSDVESFKDGTCRVKRTGRVTGNDNPWGVIDRDGNFVKMWENNNAEHAAQKVGEIFWNIGKIISIAVKILR